MYNIQRTKQYFKCIFPCPYTSPQKSCQNLHLVPRELSASDINFFSVCVEKQVWELQHQNSDNSGEKSQFKLATPEGWQEEEPRRQLGTSFSWCQVIQRLAGWRHSTPFSNTNNLHLSASQPAPFIAIPEQAAVAGSTWETALSTRPE